MAGQLVLSEVATMATPAAGKVNLYVSNASTPVLRIVDDAGGVVRMIDSWMMWRNFSASTVSAGYATDTLLAGSELWFGRLVTAGARYHLIFDMTKTAAGVATPILKIRYGLTGTAADTAILTFTFTAGSAAADTGTFEVWLTFRTTGYGTSAVVSGIAQLRHNLAATGLTTGGTGGSQTLTAVSDGFESAAFDSWLSASFDGGANFSGTCVLVESFMTNLWV